MAKYKVEYSGFAYVKADSMGEAAEKYDMSERFTCHRKTAYDIIYEESKINKISEQHE